MRVNVYVDGFDPYYGSVEGTRYKWLDIARLIRRKMPADSISRIRYFTALVTGRPADPQQPQRQLTYIRALQTIPNVSVHYGQFMSRVVTMRVAKPPPDYCRVIRTDENLRGGLGPLRVPDERHRRRFRGVFIAPSIVNAAGD